MLGIALGSKTIKTKRLLYLSFLFGMVLPCIAFGGILARALGDALLAEGSSANYAIPELFIYTMPAWLAALVGAGVLAAIMSTADGLLVSTSQILLMISIGEVLLPDWF